MVRGLYFIVTEDDLAGVVHDTPQATPAVTES